MSRLLSFSFLMLLLLGTGCFAAPTREIALTIDDLPFVGEDPNHHLEKIINTLVKSNVPATGFVIAGQVNSKNRAILQKFRDAGFSLGNHTLTHANLNRLKASAYIEEIASADKILAPYLTKPKFFRYPFLAMGEGEKKEDVQHYLATNKYHLAPITIDSRDFVFNQLLLAVAQNERRFFMNVLKPCYIDFIWEQTLKNNSKQAQILLIHANLLNAYALEDIINLYQQNGYTFITLEKALKTNHAYALPAKKPTEQKEAHPALSLSEYIAWD